MKNQYEYKLPEYKFKRFKKDLKSEMKKLINKNAKKVSELLTNMDSEEYEFPDSILKYYESSGNHISMKNIRRIHRVQKILKNAEDDEQTGKFVINVRTIKNEQKSIEKEILKIIGQFNKPRFIKTSFKPKTIGKFKNIIGNYFGLPA